MFLELIFCDNFFLHFYQYDDNFFFLLKVVELWPRKYLQFYAEQFCLSKPMLLSLINTVYTCPKTKGFETTPQTLLVRESGAIFIIFEQAIHHFS